VDVRSLYACVVVLELAAASCRSVPNDLPPPLGGDLAQAARADLSPPADLAPTCGPEGQPCVPGADAGCACRFYQCMMLPATPTKGVCVLAGP
jgi:hypothetical protein